MTRGLRLIASSPRPDERVLGVDVGHGRPETRHAKSEDGYIAYQVFGQGSFDLLFIGNLASKRRGDVGAPSMTTTRGLGACSATQAIASVKPRSSLPIISVPMLRH